jgi:hypothetical protein
MSKNLHIKSDVKLGQNFLGARKFLGRNFIFGSKKIGSGWRGVPGKQYSKPPTPVVSMSRDRKSVV